MSWIKDWIIKMEAKVMLTKLWAALEGYKTYCLAGVGILIAIVGHFWGPVDVGSLQIPAFSWNDVFQVAWQSGLFSFLHMKK